MSRLLVLEVIGLLCDTVENVEDFGLPEGAPSPTLYSKHETRDAVEQGSYVLNYVSLYDFCSKYDLCCLGF